MLNFLPSILIGIISLIFMVVNTVFWCGIMYGVILFKLLIPHKSWQRFCTKGAIWLAEAWISSNSFMMRLLQKTDWQLTGLDGLHPDDWYVVVSNHQSWVDIIVLQHLFNKRIPFLKFFLKQVLIWVPVIGLAWWGLDFPFMKRYSRDYLAKHPEKRGKDLETTRKACERFKFTAVSVMNFMEGTRFKPHKHAKQQSPYKNLLRPKAGGIAYVLAAMDGQIKTMINVTIVYPDGVPGMWEFFSGQLKRVIVNVEKREIPVQYLEGDYQNDTAFREQFQAWVRDLWEEKDALIGQIKGQRQTIF